VNVSA